MNKFKLICVCLLMSHNLFAKWKVVETIDEMDDTRTSLATITNSQGYQLSLRRVKNGNNVMMGFIIPSNSSSLIANKPIMLRVDKNKAHTYEKSKYSVFEWKPKWIAFDVWHGNNHEGLSPILKEMTAGNKIIVRYTLPSGEYKLTRFSLKGSTKAFIKALRIINPKSKEGKDKNEYSAFFRPYLTNLNGDKEKEKKALACHYQTKPDIVKFKKCMNQ
jgi:hypothetical protein